MSNTTQNQQSSGQERRYAVRVPCNRPVVVKGAACDGFATMTDFSKHGLGFILKPILQEGEYTELFDKIQAA